MSTHTTSPVLSPPAAEPVVALDQRVRWALLGDGALATVLGLGGLLTGHLQAQWTGLPPELHLAASVGLLPYAVRALQTGRGRTARTGRLSTLLVINVVYAVTAAALLVNGWLEPTVLGTALLVSYIAVPGAVGACIAATLRRGTAAR
ncbi:hypothetical protein CLV92_11762 [Kineococcus xinjiangensis]|uniref:Uncharacterized protein n=1 Tax=Kineococcus xinjiangensis TaxID=512762 RepID=A0A2S6ID23_9ACTN|nr:hypothetical protein [Kineococcus xinjiangensis]PPK92097.1 hypothetical protein CLV92_11762 [Kineococcus xinjiangensis]